jgi:hypothetical protein
MGRARQRKIERRIEATNYRDPSTIADANTVAAARTEAEEVAHRLAEKWKKMDIPGQVKVARSYLRQMGATNFRAQFLPGFKEDLADKMEESGDAESVAQFYMSYPEFVSFWSDIGMDEAKLREMLPKTATSVATTIVAPEPTPPPPLTPEPVNKKMPFWKRWLLRSKEKADKAVITQNTAYSNKLYGLLDTVIDKKIANFAKKGVPLTVERLMEGSGMLVKMVGIPEQEIRGRIEEKLKGVKQR